MGLVISRFRLILLESEKLVIERGCEMRAECGENEWGN